jgi:hypothetical protein
MVAVERSQARAHVLLKAKEAELRAARETGAASEAHQAELAAAKAALADAQAAVDAVCSRENPQANWMLTALPLTRSRLTSDCVELGYIKTDQVLRGPLKLR